MAVFLREIVMDQLVGVSRSNLPGWFDHLSKLGLASVESNLASLPVTSFSFKRDAVLFILPIAAGFSDVVLYMALAGGLAAALLGASATILSTANVLAEDGVGGLVWEPPASKLRITVARVALVMTAVVVSWVAAAVPADPLRLMLWAFAFSASTSFPVVVLSIWWKRLNAAGAFAGLLAGFVVTVLAILVGQAAWLGIPSELSAVFGMPASIIAAIIVARATPPPDRPILQLVADMRLPGGETMQDREARLQRLKHRQGL